MKDSINILSLGLDQTITEEKPEAVKIDESITMVQPFTGDGFRANVHYSPEVRGYVICNEGIDCVLCVIGRKREERILLPVYLPSAGIIGVLPISTSNRPFALLPQVINGIKDGKPVVLLIRRENAKYWVSSRELAKDADKGEKVIEKFQQDMAAGRVRLEDIYSRISNDELAKIPEIANMLTILRS